MESTGTLLAVLTSIVAVPLTIITFYLRSLREHQAAWSGELVRRLATAESETGTLRRLLGDFERQYATKEEWLRECMHTRRTLEQLSATTVRIETVLNGLIHPRDSARQSLVNPADFSGSP